MSDFYKQISKYYKYIFPVTEAKINFLTDSIGVDLSKAQVLDIAAGSGEVASALKNIVGQVIAIDLEESMVLEMKQKCLKSYQMNMLNMKFDQKFDLIYCIGNSLCHLDNLEDVRKFIVDVISYLKDKGKLVIQIVNYNNFWKQALDGAYLGCLPTIENDQIKFERKYFKEGDKIRFHTILSTEDGIYENDELLLPILHSDLCKIFSEIGTEILSYGSFNRSQGFNLIESQFLVIESK